MDIFSAGLIGFGILMALGFLVIYILYLLNLQKTLQEVSLRKRRMEPSNVWLMLIPLFNIVWQFIVIDRLADSIQHELQSRGIAVNERPAYNVGLAYCVLTLCGWIPILGSFASLGFLVCFVIHWVKINEYRKRLIATRDRADKSESTIFY